MIYNKIIVLLLLPFIISAAIDQNELRSQIDSALVEEKIALLIKLGKSYAYTSKDSMHQIFHKAIDLAETTKNAKLQGDVFHEFGYMYYKISETDSSYIYFKKALKFREIQKDSTEIGIILNRLGNVYWFLDKQITSKEYHEKALEIHTRIGNDKEIGRSYNNLGYLYQRWDRYQKSLEYFLKASEYYEKINYPEGLAWLNFSIGMLYKKINDYENALKSMNTSLGLYKEIVKSGADSMGIMICYGQLGDIYRLKGDLKNGLYYNEEALKLRIKTGINSAIADGLVGVGQVYYELGKYYKSIDYMQRSKKLREERRTSSGIDVSLKFLGFNYYKLGRISEALTYLKQGLKIAKQLNKLESQKEILEKISRIYEENDNYPLALNYFQKYDAVKDSLSKSEFNKQLSGFKLQMEINDRKKENEKLALANKINSLELERSETLSNFLYLAIAFFVFIILVIIYFYKKKHKDNQILLRKNEEISGAYQALEIEINERKEVEKQREKLISDLKESISEIKTLSGLIPICANCKKIRNDQGFYEQVEAYIESHTDAQFSHGICSDCEKELYGDQDWYKKSKKK